MSIALAESEVQFDPSSPESASEKAVALVVDDSPLDRRLAGHLVERAGMVAVYAADGRAALEMLTHENPVVVLTDLQMPNMDGLELVQAIRSDHPGIPVILMTSRGSEEFAIAALKAGASHYLSKRNLRTELSAILPQVLAAARVDRRRHDLLSCVEHLDCRFVLENDPSMVPLLVAHMQEQVERMDLCDRNSKIRIGVALEEALLNAIYHGNLEVSSDLKQESHDAFQRLAERRRFESPYCRRRVTVDAHLNPQQAVFVIRDEGPGFDVAALPDPTDPENMLKPSGRGILLIRTFMDEAVHNATGNELTLVKRRPRRE